MAHLQQSYRGVLSRERRLSSLMITGFGDSRLERYLHNLTISPYDIGVTCRGNIEWAEIILTTDKTLAYAQIRDLYEFGFVVDEIQVRDEEGDGIQAIEVLFCRKANLV